MLHNANHMPPVLHSSNMIISSHDMNMMAGPSIPMPVPAPLPVPPVGLPINFPMQQQQQQPHQDVDLRNVIDPRMARATMDQDMRNSPMDTGFPPPLRNIPPPRSIPPPQQQRPAAVAPSFPNDPRQRNIDPRVKAQQQQHLGSVPSPVGIPPPQQSAPQVAAATAAAAASQSRLAGGIPNNASDQEKAALIMQVLQLSDEQIAMLPPEQRASILVLKEQIAKSTQR